MAVSRGKEQRIAKQTPSPEFCLTTQHLLGRGGTARQAIDDLWTEARGQQKQSNDPGNNQHVLNTPTIERR